MAHRVIQFRRMTDAQRLAFTPVAGEGVWATDTSLFYVGDGSTAGGVAVGGGGGVTDHGALTGLGDDDHPQYLMADGTRALSGDMAVTAMKKIDGRDISVDGTKLDLITGTNTGDEVDATLSVKGIVEIATQMEVNAGADAVRVVTPATYIGSTKMAKLDLIEDNATADQTNAEIRNAVEAAADSNTFTDADHTKLDGIATGAVADHGAIAGLADDDHTQYARADGTRDISGLQTFLAGLTSTAGTSTFGLFQATGNGSISKNTPLFTMFNSVAGDADAARSASQLAGGLTVAAVLHYLSQIETEHDGAGADEMGRMIMRLNLSTSGLGAMDEVLRLDKTGIKTFGHELADYYIHVGTQLLIAAAGFTKLTGLTTRRQDPSFTVATNTVTANYTGEMRINYSIAAFGEGTNTRGECLWIVKKNGVEIAGIRRMSYHRAASAIIKGRGSVAGECVIPVTSGDTFDFFGSAIVVDVTVEYASFIFERKQQP